MKWIKIILLVTIIMSVFTTEVNAQQVPKWAQDQLQLRDIIKESIQETQKWQNSDGALYPYLNLYKWDDEVEIFYFWLAYYFLTGDESVYESVKGIAQTYIRRAELDNQFDHGYYRDAFFDTEHTLEGMIILASLAWARPDDEEIVNALVDVVEHAANLVPDYRIWYVEDTNLMRSVRLGTQKVEKNKSSAVDWVFNLQFVKMALAAYHANGDDRLLNWSKNYLDGWIKVMNDNEKENGYYLLPSSVDPYTGQIGPYSGVWWQANFEPGWGWPEKGNNANRDMRGAFLGCYKLTGEKRFLTALKKHVQTLFDNGTSFQPAHYFDGETWHVDDDKVTVNMAAGVSLMDENIEAEFDDFMWSWYDYLRYPYPEQHFWAFQKSGGLSKIDAINYRSIDNAQKRLNDIKAVTSLPAEPDDFPTIGGYWGITLVPFGGVSAQRGEMPWQEVVYYKADKSLGLYNGVAALFESKNDSSKSVYLCNTTDKSLDMWIQSGYTADPIKCLFVDGQIQRTVEGSKAKFRLPAHHTMHVQIINQAFDDEPPAPVQMLSVFGK
jgi:hypothetical protein